MKTPTLIAILLLFVFVLFEHASYSAFGNVVKVFKKRNHVIVLKDHHLKKICTKKKRLFLKGFKNGTWLAIGYMNTNEKTLSMKLNNDSVIINSKEQKFDVTNWIYTKRPDSLDLVIKVKKENDSKLYIYRIYGYCEVGELKTSYNQDFSDKDCQIAKIPTAIFTLDMCLPCSKAMSSNMKNRRRMTMRHNELAAFRIINNNPLRYTVKLAGKEIDLHPGSDFNLNPEPIEYKSDESDKLTVDEETTEEFASINIDTLAREITRSKNRSDTLKQFLNDQNSDSNVTINSFNQFLLMDLKNIIDDNDTNNVEKKLSQKLRNAKRFNQIALQNEYKGIESFGIQLEQSLNNLNNQYQKKIDLDSQRRGFDFGQNKSEIFRSIEDYEFVKTEILKLDDVAISIKSFDKLENEVTSFYDVNVKKNCLENSNEFQQKTNQLTQAYRKFSSAAGTSKTMISSLNKKFSKIIGSIEDISNEELIASLNQLLENVKKEVYDRDYESRLKNIEERLIKLNSVVTESYTLLYQMLAKNKDLLEINLSRKDNISNENEEYNYEIWVRNGFKIDMSAGVFLSTLKNNSYATKESESDTTARVIFKQDNGMFTFAFGTLLHATWRMNEIFNPGVSVGFAFTNETEYQLMTGFTAFIGKRSRIGLNAGASWGFVKRLDGAYEAGNNTTFSGSTPPTIDTFCQGLYFGFTYNLFTPQSDSKK